jgi:DNA (cytosine-5)-methyltransferase 1
LLDKFPQPLSNKKYTSVTDPNYPDIKISIEDLHDYNYDTGLYEIEWKKAQNAKQNHPYMGRMSFPENIDNPSRTIMATLSRSTREAIIFKSETNRKGNGEYRTPTIREAAVIMGFPITYQFCGNESTKWRQIGNAVCVQLSYALANKIKEKLGVHFEPPFNAEHKFDKFIFLDSPLLKKFDNPPKRSPKALFRAHPIKTGNMTIDLMNRYKKRQDGWCVVAHVGTGVAYTTTNIMLEHCNEAKAILLKTCPIFVDIIDADDVIEKCTQQELDVKNVEHGLVCSSLKHPYNIVNKIGLHIQRVLNNTDDPLIYTENTKLSIIKNQIPLSQIMSIYSLGIVLYGE